ncbi:MAG: MFS transporter [Thermoplasmata archaeon]
MKLNLDRFKEEWKVVGVFYLNTVLVSFAFSLTNMVEFIYIIAIGLSFFQMGVIWFIFGVIHAVFEIPTGIVADKYGRKLSLLIGLGICGLSYILLPLNENFYFVLLFFSLFAFGSTFVSGAGSALKVDYLKHREKKHWIHRVSARSASLGGLVSVPAALLGAYVLYRFSSGAGVTSGGIMVMKSFFAVHGILFLISFILFWLKIDEPPLESTYEGSFIGYVKNIAKKSADYTLKNRVVLALYSTIFVFFFCFVVIQNAWQPFLVVELNFRLYWLGIIAALVSFISFLINIKSEDFTEWIGDYRKTLILLTILIALAVIAFPTFGRSYGAIGVYILVMAILSFYKPIRWAYFAKNIPSEIRATMSSIDSFIIEMGAGMGSLVLFGAVSEMFSLTFALILSGVILIPSTILYLLGNNIGKESTL